MVSQITIAVVFICVDQSKKLRVLKVVKTMSLLLMQAMTTLCERLIAKPSHPRDWTPAACKEVVHL